MGACLTGVEFDTRMKKRDANIELWRCFCMYAVVLGHILANNNICYAGGVRWHIPGFLLISGYFGITFSFRKVFKLVALAYSCYWLTMPLRWGQDSVVSLLLPHGGWFLPFYLVLMLMSPLFNAMIKNGGYALVIVVLLLFVGWVPALSNNPHVSMMKIPGMQGNGMLLMLATYCIGHAVRDYQLAQKGNLAQWGAAFALGVVLMSMPSLSWVMSNDYCSPFVIGVAVLGFVFCLHLPKDIGYFGKVITFIAPSMFSVYLIHECCLKRYQYGIFCGADGEGVVVRSLLIFFGCIGIDMVRRGLVHLIYNRLLFVSKRS